MSHLMSKQLHNYRSVPKWEPLAETAEEKEIRIRQPAGGIEEYLEGWVGESGVS